MIDDSQDYVIHYPLNKSIFVIAPPGYGKTHVMTERINHIISSQSIKLPNKILAITFTNAASNELKRRLNQKIPESTKYVDSMNFHTFAFNLLKLYGNYVGLDRNFIILNDSSNRIKEKVEEIVKNTFLENNRPVKKIYDYNDWFKWKYLHKNDRLANDDIFTICKNRIDEEIYSKSEISFNILLFKAIELLEKNELIRDCYFNKYSYICVDEFQDTNYLQYQILKLLISNSKGKMHPIFCVGDPHQAIMRFQGSRPENIEFIIKEFNCEKHSLKNNHRMKSLKISEIASKIRDENYELNPKCSLKCYITQNSDEECLMIINAIKELLSSNVKPNDIAILSPQVSQLNRICSHFESQDIDYALVNDFKRNQIFKKYELLFNNIELIIKKKIDRYSVSFIIKRLAEIVYSYDSSDFILNNLIKYSQQFDSGKYSQLSVPERLELYYNYIQLEIDWDKIIKEYLKNRIILSTIHGAKGLEFEHVFILGIVKNSLPHFTKCRNCNDLNRKEQLNEEKDLFYVAISRAIRDCTFSFSKYDTRDKPQYLSCIYAFIAKNIIFIDNMGNELSFDNFTKYYSYCNLNNSF